MNNKFADDLKIALKAAIIGMACGLAVFLLLKWLLYPDNWGVGVLVGLVVHGIVTTYVDRRISRRRLTK